MDAGVSSISDFYAFVSFFCYLFPICVAEDAVLAHCCYSAGWIFLEGLEKKEFELLWELFVYLRGIVANPFHKGVIVSCMKWTLSMQHLVKYASNSIDIAFEVD